MKKYLGSLIAVIIAIGAVAFTAPANKADTYVFEYAGPNTPGEVQELENWEFVGKNLQPCDGENEKACRIFVSEENVDDTQNPTALQSFVTITEGISTSGVYVSTISGQGTTLRSNRSN